MGEFKGVRDKKVKSLKKLWLEMCYVLSHSVVSDSLPPHGLSPPGSSIHGSSPGKNIGVGCHAILQGIFPTQKSNPDLPHHGCILYHLGTREAQEYWSGYPIPFPGDLPNPGIKLGSPVLQVDSLPSEPPANPKMNM